jgi:membrane fusion protein, copper/silver efflux system
MDEKTSFVEAAPVTRRSRRRPLRTLLGVTLLIAVVVIAAAAGFRLGRADYGASGWLPPALASFFHGQAADRKPPTGPVIYYRDPDGKPAYSDKPTNTADGRPYVSVLASEDVSFDERAPDQAAIDSTRRILYYRNPMGLPDTSPVPKKDSMGMDYLPVYEGEASDDGTVKLSPGKVQRTGVRSEPAVRKVITRMIRVPGVVKLDERQVTVVSMRADSFIERVEDVTTGDRVRKGQRLLEIFSPEVNAAAAQLISNTGFEGSRRRLENLNVPADVIAEMERTRKVPLSIVWAAPRDGVVLERNATEGMKAASGQVLFRIADLSVVWVLADIPERDTGSIKVGQAVTLRARSMPGRSLHGQVSVIYPQINAETRTARIRIEIENKESVLLPEMYVDVDLATGPADAVVAIPESALIDTGTRQIVILDKGDGRFEPREVIAGARGDQLVEIRNGLDEGDQVVTSANFLIDAESNLKAALRGMAPAEQPQ